MTDTVAALSALKDGVSAERDDLFARFEAKWRDEPLVLDKWFTLEALSSRADTLARVQALLAHPRFNARNPNRVRSLVGAFALRNFARFHAADGRGYAFAADQVLMLDATNPQSGGDRRFRVQPLEALPRATARAHAGGAAAYRRAPRVCRQTSRKW
jgi:aminopeptidase N